MAIEGGFEQLNNAETLCHYLHNRTFSDSHWLEINCAKMEDEDAILINKFINRELSDDDIDERMERLKEADRNNQKDSSYVLAALLKNKLVANRHWERKEKETGKEAQL